MIETAPRLPSGKELIVLELLSGKPAMYGLEMVKASTWLGRGTVYVLLSRMEDKGYVSSRQEKVETQSGMPRRLYSITGIGQRALHAARRTMVEFGLGALGG